jgi:CspA family cold shock protein
MSARYSGTLVRWFDGRGFGFIRPDDGGRDVFVAAREFDRAGLAQPHEGQALSFKIGLDRDGRPCAEALDDDTGPAVDIAGVDFVKA